MSFKENLKAKINLDRLLQKLVSTIKEPPGKRWLDKDQTRELLGMTDFKHKKFRDLHLYLRPLEGEIMEVLVLDNELPIYHTTVDDVALRKSPYWQQMFSIRNVEKKWSFYDSINIKRATMSFVAEGGATWLEEILVPRDSPRLLRRSLQRSCNNGGVSGEARSLS